MSKVGRCIIESLDFLLSLNFLEITDEEKFVIKDQLQRINNKIK